MSRDSLEITQIVMFRMFAAGLQTEGSQGQAGECQSGKSLRTPSGQVWYLQPSLDI